MPAAYSADIRGRVIASVESGASRREAAEEFLMMNDARWPCPTANIQISPSDPGRRVWQKQFLVLGKFLETLISRRVHGNM
jgi:hypothetical protein